MVNNECTCKKCLFHLFPQVTAFTLTIKLITLHKIIFEGHGDGGKAGLLPVSPSIFDQKSNILGQTAMHADTCS